MFDMFRQGAERPRLVGRDRFIQLVQASPIRLQTALLMTPLISSTRVIQPMNWGDFLWYLSQVDAISISWSDILATACWCRTVSLGLATGQRHPSQMSPRISVAESRAWLDEYRRRAEAQTPTRVSSPSSRFHLPPCLLCRNWLPRYPSMLSPPISVRALHWLRLKIVSQECLDPCHSRECRGIHSFQMLMIFRHTSGATQTGWVRRRHWQNHLVWIRAANV